MSLFTNTFLGLVSEKAGEAAAADEPCTSMEEAVGRLAIELHRLRNELVLNAAQQNSENVLESLVALAVTCTRCAEDLVLPDLEEETE